MKDKKKIYVDFDGVLADTVSAIVELYNKDFCMYEDFKHIDPKDINSWWFDECKCTNREYIDHYFNQPRMFQLLETFRYAEGVLSILSLEYNIVIVTMCNQPNEMLKKAYCKENFPYATLICVDFKDYKDKSHIDMSDGLFFIDDSANNLITSNCPNKICFGEEKSWNTAWKDKRCKDWIDVLESVRLLEKSES